MTDAAVFQGTYSDLCFRKTRSVAVISVEIPIEMAGAFVAAFGAPVPGAEIPVALARLSPTKPVSEAPKGAQVVDKTETYDAKRKIPYVLTEASQSDLSPRQRRKFADMPLAAQAGMRCEEPAFIKFIEERNFPVNGSAEVAQFIRDHCGVGSRSEIIMGSEAASKWHNLMRQYELWLLAAEPT